jgi:Dehydrogenases with different specificities (related to short-chain alcohol dehydrogenases)
MKLKKKVALITAAGGAIGGAQARLFSAEGAKVVVADINYISAKKVSDQIINDKGEAIPIKLNVKDSNSWKNCIKKVIDKFGTINILCNNAGANFRVDFEDQSESQFREIIDVGLIGSFLGIKHTNPHL